MCNHNASEKDTTIVFSNKKNMVNPEVKFGYCSECGEIIEFVKQDGKYIKK